MSDSSTGHRALPPGQTLLPALKVQHYGRVPRADPQTWVMSFTTLVPGPDGAIPHELGRMRMTELEQWPRTRMTADLHCASGWSVHDLDWEGVPASLVVERFPPPPDTTGVLVYAEYGFCANVRLEDLMAPTTLLATRLNGEPLSPEHGYPVRLAIPHLYSYKSIKWFRGWEYLTREHRGFWEERGYHLIGDPWTGNRYSYQE